MNAFWPWLALFGLGAYHGINPGMGWLFAVALGLQEKSPRAILLALPPIGLGHALSIASVACLLWLAQASVPETAVRIVTATLLLCFGLYRLLRARHPAWVGMRVGFRDLTLWSFMMATAHGAGLMLLPVFLYGARDIHSTPSPSLGHGVHAAQLATQQWATFDSPLHWIAAVGVHTIGHLIVAGLVALIVYEKLGLTLLRHAWFNFDLVWAVVLISSGALIFLG